MKQSKEIWNCYGQKKKRTLAPLSYPIRFKIKPTATCSPALFRDQDSLLVLTLSSHWLSAIFSFFWLAVVITLILVFSTKSKIATGRFWKMWKNPSQFQVCLVRKFLKGSLHFWRSICCLKPAID